jgi:hypothetical protein
MALKNEILLGYEIKTAKPVKIKPAHLVVTGITQESGKTTTLEALVKRGRFKAVFFKTKIGEAAIREGTLIAPYYKDIFDWEYAAEILEASRKEKLKFERSWIIKYAKKANNLLEFKANIDQALAGKLRELERSVLITLQAYLEKIIPELQYAPLSNTLNLNDDINIMDIERFKEETQALVIRSVLLEVLKNYRNTIVVLPEAWRYIPERIGSPVKRPAEAFIRQGASNNNYLWMDSQDITGVSKVILKQVSNWILGYQREINEIKRTLDQIPLTKRHKPKPEDIASLKLGHFFVATSQLTTKVYVLPAWLDKNIAIDIAKGKEEVSNLERPKTLVPFSIQAREQQPIQSTSQTVNISEIKAEIIELRNDFFTKLQNQQTTINNLASEIYNLKAGKQEIDKNEIVSLVLQKMPVPTIETTDLSGSFESEESIIQKVLNRIPKGQNVTYEVAPLEKIKKDFLQEARDKIIRDINILNSEQKKILKFVETQGKGCNQTQICSKCLYVSATSGGTRNRISKQCKEMAGLELVRMDKNAVVYAYLKDRVKQLMGLHDAKDDEIEQVYNHILTELINHD